MLRRWVAVGFSAGVKVVVAATLFVGLIAPAFAGGSSWAILQHSRKGSLGQVITHVSRSADGNTLILGFTGTDLKTGAPVSFAIEVKYLLDSKAEIAELALLHGDSIDLSSCVSEEEVFRQSVAVESEISGYSASCYQIHYTLKASCDGLIGSVGGLPLVRVGGGIHPVDLSQQPIVRTDPTHCEYVAKNPWPKGDKLSQ